MPERDEDWGALADQLAPQAQPKQGATEPAEDWATLADQLPSVPLPAPAPQSLEQPEDWSALTSQLPAPTTAASPPPSAAVKAVTAGARVLPEHQAPPSDATPEERQAWRRREMAQASEPVDTSVYHAFQKEFTKGLEKPFFKDKRSTPPNRYVQELVAGALPAGIYQPEIPVSDGLPQKIGDVAAGTAGMLASFMLPAASVNRITKIIGLAGALSKLDKYGKAGKIASNLLLKGANNVLTFGVHGQIQSPLDVPSRLAVLGSSGKDAVLFTAAGTLGGLGTVGKVVLEPAALFAIGAANGETAEDRIINGTTLVLLHATNVMGQGTKLAKRRAQNALVQMGQSPAIAKQIVESVNQTIEPAGYRALIEARAAKQAPGAPIPPEPSKVAAPAPIEAPAPVSAMETARPEPLQAPTPLPPQPAPTPSGMPVGKEVPSAGTVIVPEKKPVAGKGYGQGRGRGYALKSAEADSAVADFRKGIIQSGGIDFPADGDPMKSEILAAIPRKYLKSRKDTMRDGHRLAWDEVHKTAMQEGLLPENPEYGPSAMFDLFSRKIQRQGEVDAAENARYNDAKQTAIAEQKKQVAIAQSLPVQPVNEAEFLAGDMVLMADGQWRKVTHPTKDTTRLVDGTDVDVGSFDVVDIKHRVSKGNPAYPSALEKFKAQTKAETSAKPVLSLESSTPEQLAIEATRRAQSAELERRANASLAAKPIDTTGDLFDPSQAENPLFAVPTPKPGKVATPPPPPIPLTEHLAAGTPVTPPKTAAFLRVTDAKGNEQVVAAKDADTLKGAGPFKTAEWGNRRGMGKREFVPLEEKASSQDLAAEAKAKGKEGALTLPEQGALTRLGERLRNGIRRMGVTGGLGEKPYGWLRDATQTKSYFNVKSRTIGRELASSRAQLRRDFTTEQINQAVDAVLNKQMTPDQFAALTKLNPNGRYVESMREFLTMRDANSKALVKAEMVGATSEADIKRAKNLGKDYTYLHVMYKKHLLGSDFVPTAESRLAARGMIEGQIEEKLARLVKRANAAARSTDADIAEYLRTGDESLLNDLAPRRRKFTGERLAKWQERKREQIVRIRDAYDKADRFVTDVTQTGDSVTMDMNTAAIRDAADGYVAELIAPPSSTMGRGGVGETTGALRERYLDEPILKALYGEITDPVVRAAATIEVQGKILALRTLQNRIFLEGKNKYWTEGMPSPELRTTVQLPNDKIKYGSLAGKYVTPEIRDMFMQTRTPSGAERAYLKLVGLQRATALMTPGSFERDFFSNLNYARAAESFSSSRYWKEVTRATRQLVGWGTGDPEAMRKHAEYVRKGVWNDSDSGAIGDTERLLKDVKSLGFRKVWDVLKRSRGTPDYIFKIASYEDKIARGWSHERALKHVQDYYQYSHLNPQITRDMAKIPMFEDFPGFITSSFRITGNQIRNAAQAAKTGNIVPLLRFVQAHAIQAAGLALATSMSQRGRDEIDKRLPKGSKLLNPDESNQFRAMLPGFWKDGTMVSWWSTDENGDKVIKYVPLSNVGPFPLDDTIAGVLQQKDLSVGARLGKIGGELADKYIGLPMMADTINEAIAGEPFGATYDKAGLADAVLLAKTYPKESALQAARSLGNAAGQIFGGQTYRRMRAAARGTMGEKEAALSLVAPLRVFSMNKENALMALSSQLKAHVGALEAARANKRANLPENVAKRTVPALIDRTPEVAQLRTTAEMAKIIAQFRQLTAGWISDKEISDTVSKAQLPLVATERKPIMKGVAPTVLYTGEAAKMKTTTLPRGATVRMPR